jgi:single-stranded DNA-binding protein
MNGLNGEMVFEARPVKDPELRYDANGQAMTTVRVAIPNSYMKRDKDGNPVKDEKGKTVYVDDPCFIGIVGFRKTAERMMEQLKKGHKYVLQGRLRSRSYQMTDKDKQPVVLPDGRKDMRYVNELVISNVIPEAQTAHAQATAEQETVAGDHLEPSDEELLVTGVNEASA